MAYFALSHRVLYHDTMAQGTHHFLTNFKFQCEAREHFFFSRIADVTPDGRALLDEINVVTLDGYARSLAPVDVGDTVGILLSVEDRTPSSLRFCFRVVRRDGTPVSCGFQTIVTMSRRTGAVVVGPDAIARAAAPLTEALRRPSFHDRVLAGGSAVQSLFDGDVIRAGAAAAKSFEPSIVPDLLLPSGSGPVLLFPGQGSWDAAFLDELLRRDPSAATLARRLNDIAADAFGAGFIGTTTAGSTQALDAQQVGMYAAGVLSARHLIDRGVKPLLLLGHSFGEVTALAAGGAFDYEDGARLICARVAALKGLRQPAGGMLAVMCDESRVEALVRRAAPSSLEIALANHPGQTVVSGLQTDLQRLASILRDEGVSGVPLASRYPFHSSLLQGAVGPFAAAVRRVAVRPLHTPVYSAGEASLHARRPDLTALLPHHLVRPSIFVDAVECALGLGGRTFIECGAGRVLGGLVKKNLRGQPGVKTLSFADQAAPQTGVKASATAASATIDGPEPIAIVSIGAVLPGAADPDGLWRLVLNRETGIVDLADVDDTLVADFTARERMTPDKTYTLLCGRAPDQANPIASALTDADVQSLPTAGRFFAQAATQCVSALKSPLPAGSRIRVVIGSTADGSREYDEALVLASPAIDPSVRTALEKHSGRRLDEAGMVTGPRAYTKVARALFGSSVDVVAVDAACASSLYAIDLGVDALRERRCDVAVCGGAFAPGPASTCLFAQFQGLSATGSRPLDATADGVVFGEGSALVVLKRLSDASAAGDRVHAVIRTIAASSDGKSASVMEPKQGGQLLALRRAAAQSDIALASLQFIDAHATATPVGDAVEFASIREAVGAPSDGRHRVRVGSLKAAIGHTGWVAGAASLIEVCKALEARTFPPQVGFTSPNPRFELASSNVDIDARPAPWPPNADGLPRRAAVNGFGFGGVNAHLLLEEFDPAYHGRWTKPAPADPERDPIAIVATSSLLPGESWAFSDDERSLPPSVRILPDVLDEMDASQRLALKAVHALVSGLPESWKTLRPETAVIIGFDGKTRRGIDALVRVYIDRLKRRFAEIAADPALTTAEMPAALAESIARLERLPRTGPYTLAGAMPNVTAGRVSNVFNLNGPNFVVDAEGRSLFEAIVEASRALRAGKCRLALAGGISSSAGDDVQRLVAARDGHNGRPVGEGAVLLALTRESIARELGLPICGYLSHTDRAETTADSAAVVAGTRAPVFLMGAEGAVELSDAIERVRQQRQSAAVRWIDGDRIAEIRLAPDAAARHVPRGDSKPIPDALARLIAVPTHWTTPRWIAENAPPAASGAWTGRRVLIVTDRPSWCLSDRVTAALAGIEYRVVCPAAERLGDAIGVSMANDAEARQSARQLDDWPYDAVIALTTLEESDAIDSITTAAGFEGGLLDLMFVIGRHCYARMERGDVVFGAICLHAGTSPDRLHPFTGLPSGFFRSLSRELPRAACCLVSASDGDLAAAMDLLAGELERSAERTAPPDVCRIDGRRYVQQLATLEDVGSRPPLMTRDSVVVATGGAQGVTAVLVEAIRRQFGCATVLVGRTDPAAAPSAVLAMDEQTFDGWEPEFYRQEMAARPGVRPAELKARFNAYRSAREASATIRALEGTPGAVRYIRADVTDPAQIEAAIAQVVGEFGRVDLVVHGAGIQTSKVLEKKPLETFRAIVATKLGGLGHLVGACRRLLPGRAPHFHLVTSTFSYAGNAGQEDYGAANQAMDRLAQYLTATTGEFEASSLGWIGWVNVGMTRGSEYTMVAIQRGLGGVTRETGGECFRQYIAGRAPAAIAYVITERETTYFGIPIAPSGTHAPKPPQRLEQPLALGLVTHPFLDHHRVAGAPTLPAAFGLDIAARLACDLRPGQYLQRFDNIAVDRFVKIHDRRPFELHRLAEVIEERDGTHRILVKLMSDFVHKSGRVLEAGIVHMSSEVVLGPSPVEPPITHRPVTTVQSGWHLSDPYLHPDAPVRLGGPFRSLHDIIVTPAYSTATFDGPDADGVQTSSGALIPFVLLDALFRLAALRREDDGSALLCVPLSCARIDVWAPADGNNRSGRCTLTSSPARFRGDRVEVSWAEAVDETGRVVLTLRDIVGAVYGRVPAEVERIRPIRAEAPAVLVSPVQTPAAPAPAPLPRLDGKVALVTGAGRGIGKVVAHRLAELGAFVVVNSFHSRTRGEETTAEIVARGGKAVHAWGSVANPAQLARIFQEVDASAGGLDYFVSNASAGIFAPLASVTPEQWDRSFRTNVVALHQASFMAAERMAGRGGGRIVALSSIGTRWCFDYFGLVGSVKAAVEALVGYLAVELAPSNVEVTAVAAGAVDGELLRQYPDRPRWETQAPDGLITTELQVADAVAFLLTSNGMNGTTLVLDGASGVRTHEPWVAGSSEN